MVAKTITLLNFYRMNDDPVHSPDGNVKFHSGIPDSDKMEKDSPDQRGSPKKTKEERSLQRDNEIKKSVADLSTAGIIKGQRSDPGFKNIYLKCINYCAQRK